MEENSYQDTPTEKEKMAKSKNLVKWVWVIAAGALAGIGIGALIDNYTTMGIIGAICGVAVYVALYLKD
ncbi:MAG: hypothetical protein FWF37_03295 [Chloroflexi bacterium]|nr:hypothetical protein [Chloroflexota bacterium]